MEKLQNIAQKLQARGFQVQVCQTKDDAKAAALALIDDGAAVGFGGSMTVEQLGLYDTLREKGHPVYWHWKVEKDVRAEVMIKAHLADVYLCSSNAVLEDGRLLNIDGNGNRVASMFYGPKRLVMIIGRNKLCGDYDDAYARIKRDACPPNARRLGTNTPCGVTGKCTDCDSPRRMCKVTVLLERPSGLLKDAHVILVNEDLGY